MLEDTFGLDIGEGAPLDQEVSDEGFHGFETFKVENISSGSGSLSAATSRSSDGILYFGFPGFSFSRGMGLIYSDTESDLWKVMDEFFSALADEETKGIIIDMRGNEGGNVAELRVAFSAFFPAGVEKIHFADTRRKSGEGMLEYGPWLSFEVSKDETMTLYAKGTGMTSRSSAPVRKVPPGRSRALMRYTTQGVSRYNLISPESIRRFVRQGTLTARSTKGWASAWTLMEGIRTMRFPVGMTLR